MPDACCCYVINEKYLLPTLLSAVQLRRDLPDEAGDVVVVCIGDATESTRMFEPTFTSYGIKFLLVPEAVLLGMPIYHAIFYLDGILDRDYSEILYLDGDTQVSGSVAPLLNFTVPPGAVVATPDPMCIMVDDESRSSLDRREYFRSIGLPDALHSRYFNSGVMRFRRSDWAAISTECLKLVRANGERFAFPDQDPLNLVAGAMAVQASFRWNFPAFFLNFQVESAIAPLVYHFMSNPRPWQGAFAPWGRKWNAPYLELVRDHPDLTPFLNPLRGARFVRYVLQQRYKQVVEPLTWGSPAVRGRIARIEALAQV